MRFPWSKPEEPKIPDIYCVKCGCEIIDHWVSGRQHYDRLTGIGTVNQYKFRACSNPKNKINDWVSIRGESWWTDAPFDVSHFWEQTGEIRTVKLERKEDC